MVISTSPHEHTIPPQHKNKKLWASMVIYTLFVLFGQSSATLLGRLYYNKGGKQVLLAALLETIAFPILIPFAPFFSSGNPSGPITDEPSNLIRASVYVFLGLFQAASSVFYSIGLQNLPVSTFSLITTCQLGFIAIFSLLLNAQKFTPPILNALVLVTISSTLLIFQHDTENSKRGYYVLGFSCTLVASALYSLMLSATQLIFRKVLKRETFSTVLDMIIYQSLVATLLVLVPLFISGEWSHLRNEMEHFELGKTMYVLVLVMIALAWQLYAIGTVGLVFEVSSLFSNVISTVGLPVVPTMAAIFFHERMDGIKIISIVLATWGFVSYVYQHYIDESKNRNAGDNVELVQESSAEEKFINQESQI